MSPVISKRTAKKLRSLIDGGALSGHLTSLEASHMVVELDGSMATKRFVKLARQRKAAKNKSSGEKTSKVYLAVSSRDNARCINCGASDVHMDHFHGGSDKRTMESVEGCWMLCVRCHDKKSANSPNAVFWLRLFLDHSAEHEYAADPQKLAQGRLDSLTIVGPKT